MKMTTWIQEVPEAEISQMCFKDVYFFWSYILPRDLLLDIFQERLS